MKIAERMQNLAASVSHLGEALIIYEKAQVAGWDFLLNPTPYGALLGKLWVFEDASMVLLGQTERSLEGDQNTFMFTFPHPTEFTQLGKGDCPFFIPQGLWPSLGEIREMLIDQILEDLSNWINKTKLDQETFDA